MDTIIVPDGDNKRHIIDPKTGEILHEQKKVERWIQDDESLVITKRNKRIARPYFFMLYRSNWVNLILKKHISFAERGVFASLIAFVDWQSNFLVDPKTKIPLNESTLADLLKCDRGCIRAHIAKLNEKGLIAIVKSGAGHPNKYILNSHLVFYGQKIKDIHEHQIFSDVEYVPLVPIEYEQDAIKD